MKEFNNTLRFIATAILFLCFTPSSWADNSDFIGTFTGTATNTFTGCGASDGTYTGAYTTTSSNLNGNNFDARATDAATPPGVGTVENIGTWLITSGNTASGVQGTVNTSSGVVGLYTSASLTISGTNDEILTLTATGSLGGSCNFTQNVSAKRVTGSTVIDPSNTSSSTVTEAVLFNTQIQNTITGVSSHISGALSGVRFSGGPSITSNQFKVEGSTGLNAGDGFSIPYGVWGSYSYSDYENDLSSTAFDGANHGFLGGVDFGIWENTIIGLAFGYDRGDVDTTFNRGNQETDSYTIAPYFGAVLTDSLSVDFTVGYSRVEYDQFRIAPGVNTTRITSTPNSDRWFSALNLNAITFYDKWIIGGRVGASYASSNIGSYVESNGNIVADSRTKLSTITVAGDVAYSYKNYEPFVNLSYQNDFQLRELTATSGSQPSNDSDDILMTTGVRYFNKNGITGNLEYSKRFLREDFDEDRIGLTLRADF